MNEKYKLISKLNHLTHYKENDVQVSISEKLDDIYSRALNRVPNDILKKWIKEFSK